MKNSFATLKENILTRKFGGTTVGTADPYLTGYHFIWFESLPSNLVNFTTEGNAGIGSISDIQYILAASCMSVTPPGGTLNKVEYTGLGGIKWSVPGNIDYGNAVTIKFTEFNKTPIFDIFHGWFKLIRDYRTGVTDLIDGDEGDGYSKSTYAGGMYYWTTTPDAQSIEYYAYYDGMFPNKDPQDLFTSDVETVGKLEIEIEFNVDTAWHEPWVKTKCESYLDNFSTAKAKVEAYKAG